MNPLSGDFDLCMYFHSWWFFLLFYAPFTCDFISNCVKFSAYTAVVSTLSWAYDFAEVWPL